MFRIPSPSRNDDFFFLFSFCLSQALEEEIEGLKAELVNAEAANDELNLELQEMQERELTRCHATPRGSLRFDSLRHAAMRRDAIRSDALPVLGSSHVTSCHAMPCYVMSYHVISCCSQRRSVRLIFFLSFRTTRSGAGGDAGEKHRGGGSVGSVDVRTHRSSSLSEA